MSQKSTVFLVIAAISSIFSACSGSVPGGKELDAANTGKELVSINGTKIREGYINMLSEINPRIKAQINNPATRKQLLQNIVEQELLYQESLKRGLDKKPDVTQKAALYNKIIVSQALLEDELNERAKKYYEENKAGEFTKVKIAQIQVNFLPEDDKKDPKKADAGEPTPAQKDVAQAKIKLIQTKLKGGEDFAKLAEELSDDKSTKKKGGEFGPISKADKRLARRGLEALGEAAFQLKKGDVSDPIETKTGYHLIKVLSDPEVSPLEEAEKMIRFQLQKEVKDELVGKLTKVSNITYADGEPVKTIPVKTEPLEAGEKKDEAPVDQAKPEDKKTEGNSFKPVLKTEEKTKTH